MTTQAEPLHAREEGRELPASPPDRDATAQSAQRAKASLTVVPSSDQQETPESGTQSDRKAASDRARDALKAAAGRSKGVLSGQSLLDIDPPAIRSMWVAHRTVAAKLPPAMNACRTGWAALHVVIACAVYALLWLLASPALTITCAAIIGAWILFWS